MVFMPQRMRPTRPAIPPSADPSPVTPRAVAIGMFLGVAVNLVMLYNDYYLHNTLLVLNHFPTVSMAVLLAMVCLNVALRPSGQAFSPGEMALVWCLVSIAGGIGSTGFARCIIGFIASPAYFATGSNEYVEHLVRHIPAWAVVSKDPDDPVLRWYFEGLPRNASLPWGRWLVPLAAWTAFFTASYAVMFAFTALLYRQWAVRERLTFPIVFVPLEVAREPRPGRRFNDFLTAPVMWAGAAVPIVVFAWNGARTYLPNLPEVPLHWGTWGWFPDRPWREFNLGMAHVYFAIVGLTFLLTTEVAFSLWFFYLAYRLSFVWIAWLGAGGETYWSAWNQRVAVTQSAGGIFVIAAFLLWNARDTLRGWWSRAVRGRDDPAEDLLPPRLTVALLGLGFVGLVGFVALHGAQVWAAVLGMTLFVAVILFLARLVAEAGVLLVGVEAIGYEFLHNVFPAKWLSAGTLTTYVQLRGGHMADLRELLMPYLMNGLRLCAATGRHARKVLAVFALMTAVSLVAACVGRITTAYKYGATLGDASYNFGWQAGLYPDVVKRLKTPPVFPWIRLGDADVAPVGLAHVATGAVATAGMLVMRAYYLWWPLNPIGYLMCGSWPITEIWFSVFLGWAAKSGIMTFGGAIAYRRVLPWFLGLALGQAIIATFWTLMSLVTGQPGVHMMPQ